MAYEITTHRIIHRFEVEIERDDNDEKERRYRAYCKGLSGCWVYAGTKVKALYKIRQAIDAWLDVANRVLGDDVLSIQEMIDMRIPD